MESTFCTYVGSEYHQFDIILPSLKKKKNVRTIAEAKRNKAKRLQHADFPCKKSKRRKNKTCSVRN